MRTNTITPLCECLRAALPAQNEPFVASRWRRILGAILAKSKTAVSALWKAHYARRQPVIAKFHAILKRHLDFARAETLRKIERVRTSQPRIQASEAAPLKAAGAAADFLFNYPEFANELLAAMRAEHRNALQTAGDQFFDEIDIDDPFTMPDPLVNEFLANRENRISEASQEIFNAVKSTLQEGFNDGDSMDELAKRVAAQFDEMDEGRAKTIASTETAAAYGAARQAGMKQAGIDYKEWLGSGLPNMRSAHREADGQIVPVDEPFYVGGEALQHPGDPAGRADNVINCHCVSIAAEQPASAEDDE